MDLCSHNGKRRKRLDSAPSVDNLSKESDGVRVFVSVETAYAGIPCPGKGVIEG